MKSKLTSRVAALAPSLHEALRASREVLAPKSDAGTRGVGLARKPGRPATPPRQLPHY